MAKLPTIAAFIFRHSRGLPYVLPRNDLDYIGNFVNMTFEIGGRHEPNPVLQRALEILLILHADHEQNCSTSAVRGVGSSHVDPFSAVSAGIAALYGPLHGGANEAVLQMLDEIGDTKNVPGVHREVKAGNGRLMGFGHRVYKSYDPRATLIKRVADQVFEQTGLNPKLEIALELERIALEDEYFVSRKLYPNVDFYSGLIYQAMGYSTDYFTVLFALGRLPGWIAQWEEMLDRPRAEDLASAPDLHRRGRACLRADPGPLSRGNGQAARPGSRSLELAGLERARRPEDEEAFGRDDGLVSVTPQSPVDPVRSGADEEGRLLDARVEGRRTASAPRGSAWSQPRTPRLSVSGRPCCWSAPRRDADEVSPCTCVGAPTTRRSNCSSAGTGSLTEHNSTSPAQRSSAAIASATCLVLPNHDS